VTVTASSQLVTNVAGEIPVRNAWYLLLYAWDMARWRGRWPAASEGSPSLLRLMARVLAAATRDLLQHQLGRAHMVHRETLRGIRGRVDFAESLKRLTFEHAAAHCVFPELSIDTPKNRILRATLHGLASDPRLKHVKPEEEAKLRHELRTLVRALEGVPLVPISLADFSRLQLGRNDRDYAVPIAICALVRRLEMPTEKAGDDALTVLLHDEITFHLLFERFVRNFYRLNLEEDYEVKRETLKWNDDLGCDLVPSMQTDITMIEKLPPYRRLIIDTKYSIRTFAAAPHGVEKFKSENLYQLYAYLRTQEHKSEAHRWARGMLLYPTTGSDVNEAMSVQGHRIHIATVDLSKEWETIEARLLALVSSAYAPVNVPPAELVTNLKIMDQQNGEDPN
jgi:5-methylcytosine-specific restriction enzyme subunit McrC